MKRSIAVLAALGALVLLSACSSAPKVTRTAADTQIDLSGRWNDTDVRIVCDSLIQSALSSPRMDQFIQDFSGRNNGRFPTVIVGRFRNTTSEHIDTSVISAVMRTAIINNGRLEFVEGGDARDDIREERNDQQVNASEETAAALANETGADFMLTGTVRSVVDQADKTMVRTYFVTASLTNIETNRIYWEGENNEIKKIIEQPKAKF